MRQIMMMYTSCMTRELRVFKIRDTCLWDTPCLWLGLKSTVCHVFVSGTL
jgi:hypothetical protein